MRVNVYPFKNWQPRRFFLPGGLILLLAAALPVKADLITWTNSSDGDWSVATNWSPNEVPGMADTAVITNGGSYVVTVELLESITVSNLTLGESNGTQTLDVAGSLVCNAASLTGAELINEGVFIVQGLGTTANAQIVTASGAIISNSLGAQLAFEGNVAGTTGGCAVYNAGMLAFSNTLPAVGAMTLDALQNTGSVLVVSNALLTLENGATNQGEITTADTCGVSITTGTFDFSTNSTLTVAGGLTAQSTNATFAGTVNVGGTAGFPSGTNTFSGGGTFSNTVNVGGGKVTFLGSNNMYGTATFSGGTANFGGSNNPIYSTFAISGGTVDATNSGAINITNSVTESSGTLDIYGTGSFTAGSYQISGGTLAGYTNYEIFQVNGPLNWTGGNVNGIVYFNGGTFNTTGNLGSPPFTPGQLVNSGVLNWTPNSGPVVEAMNYPLSPPSFISNTISGTINVVLNGQQIAPVPMFPEGEQPGDISNSGQINISGAGQTGTIGADIGNFGTGTMTISNGTLGVLQCLNYGTINVASNATFLVYSGFDGFSGSSISGAGNLTVAGIVTAVGVTFGGTMNLSGAIVISNNGALASANFTGSSTVASSSLTLVDGIANFTGVGPWQTGSLTMKAASTVRTNIVSGTAPLVVSGPLTWLAGDIYGVVQCNGGVIDILISTAFYNRLGNGGQLINTGVLNWTPSYPIYTGGTNAIATLQTLISNAPGATMNIALNGASLDTYNYGGATAFYNAGVINISGAGQSGSITDPFYNTGTVNITNGTLRLTGTSFWTNGTVNFKIPNNGQLAVTGALNLNNATLGLLATGYTPVLSNSFSLITYGSETGLFSAFNLPTNVYWQPTYASTKFSLTVASLTPPALALTPNTLVNSSNGFTMSLSGPTNGYCRIQATEDLTAVPLIWVTLTNFLMTNTAISFTDPAATNYPARYYQVVSP